MLSTEEKQHIVAAFERREHEGGSRGACYRAAIEALRKLRPRLERGAASAAVTSIAEHYGLDRFSSFAPDLPESPR